MSEERYTDFRTNWTGHFPCLCYGEWQLFATATEYDPERGKYTIEVDLLHLIPEDLIDEPMYCEGEYDTWSFNEDCVITYTSYEDGMDSTQWIQENRDWISAFAEPDQYLEVFRAFQKHDWRSNSCGGCS